ncbi:class I adenylate-forming enzyme family protein [Sporichthya sp.]|uniref:class I adenylate-forming enzyme family protein n=1 Tax=Sporichthya sp. TaxID=65475 RepID=UPI0017C90190|nr:AMP-binding protein [Sporichthya sp.]MBA3743133.1 AMP-binding protein [Sporichthya sp.]
MTASLAHYLPDTSVPLWEITLGGLLADAAAEVPNLTALVSGTDARRWTYAELDRAVDRVAGSLAARLAPGDRVAVWSIGIPEFVLLQFGCARAGLVLVPLNPAYQGPELQYALEQSRSRALFVGPELRGRDLHAVADGIRADLPGLEMVERLDALEEFTARPGAAPLPAVAPLDPFMIQYTSGTTGRPKGAVLTHRGVVNNARLSALRAGIAPGGVWLNPLPMFHTGGCVFNALGAMANRGTHVLMPTWEPGAALDLLERERITFLCCVPTMLIGMMEHTDFDKRDHSSLATVLSGGSTVPPELVRRIEAELDVSFVMVFGQTESGPTVTMTNPGDPDELKAQTIGYPLPHTEVRIVDPDTGAVLACGEQGELCIRGYGRMLEYFELPAETAASIDAEGWMHSGDLARMDSNGYFAITGRCKDIIRRGGETVSPRALEDLLFGRPGVAEVAVVGVPDERLGEKVAAFIRPTTQAAPDLAALRRELIAAVAKFKVPEYWVLIDQLPLTASGKVQKFVLRDRFVAGEYDIQRLQGDTQ